MLRGNSENRDRMLDVRSESIRTRERTVDSRGGRGADEDGETALLRAAGAGHAQVTQVHAEIHLTCTPRMGLRIQRNQRQQSVVVIQRARALRVRGFEFAVMDKPDAEINAHRP